MLPAIGEANGSLCVARLTTLLEPEHGRDVSLGRGTCLALDSRLLQLGPRCPCASLRLQNPTIEKIVDGGLFTDFFLAELRRLVEPRYGVSDADDLRSVLC